MNIVAQLKQHVQSPPRDEDGELCGTKLLPPFTITDVANIEIEIGTGLTREVRDLLLYARGLEEGPMEFIEFWGQKLTDHGFSLVDGRMRMIAGDGFGNFWFYWNDFVDENLGPIYYYQHEGPMVLMQSSGIIDYVRECLRFMTPPYKSLIDDVHEFRLTPIKSLNRGLIEKVVALSSADVLLREFASRTPEQNVISDLRSVKVGDGLDLKGYEIEAIHERVPLIALSRRSTFARWLFGRRKK